MNRPLRKEATEEEGEEEEEVEVGDKRITEEQTGYTANEERGEGGTEKQREKTRDMDMDMAGAGAGAGAG